MNSVNLSKTKAYLQLLINTLVAIFLVTCLPSNAQEKLVTNTAEYMPTTVQIKSKARDDFLLFTDYYTGDERAGGVIVLHDCGNNRSSYSALAKSITQQGLHTILVDLRGYGESVSQAYSQEEAKRKATDIVSYQGAMASISAYWPEDLLAIHQFLSTKINKNKGIAVVSSGCSSAYAVSLAEKAQLSAIVMITPEMDYSDKERYKNLIDIPSYFITSANHQNSYETTQELFTWNGSKRSKVQIFKGTSYNYQLIARQKNLINDIAIWLKFNLR